ncbi:uncharacterized protein B4U80_01336 [Leptotrombidium deliense]|uniref:Vacuolar protein sorting-associated protein VTA1-like protein n=1 Tax=Leptotrombidium deliense TaxID=299467 RepID=A0A443SK42_9ACAR|nr:uncharacterized protein B4U80_01336 [Leptotrombidium deliense]
MKLCESVYRSKEALDSLRFSYFLCYNSLWGALKRKEVFPWFSFVEWCVLNEEISNYDEAFIFRTFKREGLNIQYTSSDGTYTVTTFNETQPSLKLIIFEENPQTNQYRRVGWKNRLIPPDSCTLIHCFPPRLIEKPLETVNFMDSEIPVPREEIEILKYLFPDDWWKDSEPDSSLKIDSKSKESRTFLINVMTWLEEFKKSHKENELVTNEVVAQAHIENYAMKLFERADKEDRAGAANKGTSKVYFTASQVLDCLTVFPDSSEEAAQKSKYAKWRAAYINKCLKSGDTPLPPEDNEETLDVPFPEAKSDESNVPAAGPSFSTPQPSLLPLPSEPTVPTPAAIASPVSLIAQNGSPLSPQMLIKAEKFCKWAGSSLQYEDVPTAIANLEKALAVLKTGQDVN